MTTFEEVLEGLQIFAKYHEPQFYAEHDVIYAGPLSEYIMLLEEDLKRLEELNWIHDEEGWSKFV